jgi:hypothetical protein
MGMYTAPAPGTRTGPNTVQRYPAGDPRRYANQGGVPPGSMPGKPQLVGGPVNRPIINPPPAPMPPARPMPPPQPPVGRPGGPQLIGGPVGRPIIGPPPAPMPSMPYGGPIGNPGLPPGVGIQGGPFIPPGGQPGQPPAQNNGPDLDSWIKQTLGPKFVAPNDDIDFKGYFAQNPGQDIFSLSKQWRSLYPNANELPPGVSIGPGGGMPQGPAMSGANNLIDPQTGQPIGLPTNGMGGGKAGMNGPQIGYGFNPNTGGPLGPQSQPMPNFASALGTASPLFNTIQR